MVLGGLKGHSLILDLYGGQSTQDASLLRMSVPAESNKFWQFSDYRMPMDQAIEFHWATSFEFHTPPVEDISNI